MYPVSDAFKARLVRSHAIKTLVEVYDGSNLLATLYPLSGQVNCTDEGIRRRCKATLVDIDGTLTPGSAADMLMPYGNELRFYRGLYVNETDYELVPLGVFGISDARVSDSGEALKISIEGFDRSRKVQRARFATPHNIAAGTNYVTAIQAIISARVPGVTFVSSSTTTTTPQLVFEQGSDPWEAVTKMADAIGFEVFFDVVGQCVLRPVPDPANTAPVWAYEEGPEGIILSLDRKLSDDRTYNHIVVSGETPTTTAFAEAMDDNPDSPTYYLGDFGDVTYFIKSGFITTNAQAQAVADAQLRKTLGITEQLNFVSIVNPAHDVGDIVEVVRERAKVDNRYILTDFNIPLEAAQPMNGSTKVRQLVV